MAYGFLVSRVACRKPFFTMIHLHHALFVFPHKLKGGNTEWTSIRARFVDMCMTLPMVTPKTESRPEQNSKMFPAAGFVPYAVHPKTCLKKGIELQVEKNGFTFGAILFAHCRKEELR